MAGMVTRGPTAGKWTSGTWGTTPGAGGVPAPTAGGGGLSPEHEWAINPNDPGSAMQKYVPPPPPPAEMSGYTPMGASGGGAGAGDGLTNAQRQANAQRAQDQAAATRDLTDASSRAMAALSGQGGMPSPITVTTSTPVDTSAADAAAYGQSKERTGLALKSALKGLRESMGARGLSGSGIEGQEMGDLYASGLGELADTDRARTLSNTDKNFTASQADTDRIIGQNQFNANLLEQGRTRLQAGTDRGLAMLLQIARSY